MRLLLVVLLLASAAHAQSGPPPHAAARLAYADGDSEAALELLRGDPARLSAAARLLRARIETEFGRPHLAAATLAEADTADGVAQRLLGRTRLELGDLAGSEAAYRRAARHAPSADGARALADVLVRRGRPAEALPLYRRLAASDSTNPALHAALGRTLRSLDSLAGAVGHFRRALALNPADEGSAVALGTILLDADSVEALRAHVQASLAALPRSADVWALGGAAALASDHTEAAVEGYANALHFSDSTAVRLRDLGVARYYDRDPTAAAWALRAALARDSLDRTTLRVLGMAERDLGNPEASLRLLRAAADAMGRADLADLYEQTARAHLDLGAYDDAEAALLLAEALAPEKPTLVLNRAIVYERADASPTRAISAYRAFIEEAPPEYAGLVAFAEGRVRSLEAAELDRVQEDLRRRLNE